MFTPIFNHLWVDMGLVSMLFKLLRWSLIRGHWNLRWQLMTVQVWNFTNSLLIKMNHENGFFWDNVEGRLKIFCRKVPLDAIITREKENKNSWPKIFVSKFTKKLILVQCVAVASLCFTIPRMVDTTFLVINSSKRSDIRGQFINWSLDGSKIS